MEVSVIAGRINRVIPVRIIRVVERAVYLTIQVGTGIDDIKVTDLPFDGHGHLIPLVISKLFFEVRDRAISIDKITEVLTPGALAFLLLVLELRRNRPVIVEVNQHRQSGAHSFNRVVVILGDRCVIQRDVVVGCASYAGEGAGSALVINPSSVLAHPTNQTDRGVVTQRRVDVALCGVASIVAVHHVALKAISSREARRIWLVSDNSDGAGLRAGAVERALGARQRLNSGNVVHMDVEVALNRRNRLLIQIHANTGLRCGCLSISARRDAAHVDREKAHPTCRRGLN